MAWGQGDAVCSVYHDFRLIAENPKKDFLV